MELKGDGTFCADVLRKVLVSQAFLKFFNTAFLVRCCVQVTAIFPERATSFRGALGLTTDSKQDSDMNRLTLLAAAAIVAGAAAPAVAADMAARPAPAYTKAPPMVQAAYDWSGFYIGINGGGATGRVNWNSDGLGDEGSHDISGGTVGGQIGYRWQMSSWVFGLEAQGNWADFKGSNVSNLSALFGGTTVNETKINSFGLFTGQIGYAWDRALFYVKGGAAVTDNKYTSTLVGVAFDTANETRWGAAVGVGFEYAFAPSWSFGVEYDHLFMGNNDVISNAGFITDHIKEDVDLFTARVNYKFGGPVVARY
jgi:outer membrane immunogenic protein